MSVEIKKGRSIEAGGCLACSRYDKKDKMLDYGIYEIKLKNNNRTLTIRLCGDCLVALKKEIKNVRY